MTRRLLFKYALGSTTGAGAAGAATGEAAGAETPEQELQVLLGAAHESHAFASQQLFFLQEKIFESNPQPSFLDPQPQPLSQLAALPQGSQAAISAPQLGPQPPAPQPPAHPAAFPQGSQAAISAPQVGPQPLLQPWPQPAVSAPQLGSQQLLFLHGDVRLQRSALIALKRPINGFLRHPHEGASTPQLGPHALHPAISAPQLGPQPPAPQLPAPQPLAHPAALPQGSQAAISAPQLGPQPPDPQLPDPQLPDPQPLVQPAALPHGSQAAISAPQVGPQPDPQPDPQPAISEPHDGPAMDVSQHELVQPQLRPESIRFRRSNPKLWLVKPAPRIIDPTNILNFIES